jgi:hypothetical protein
VPILQQTEYSPSFVNAISALGKYYTSLKSIDGDISALSNFLPDVWNAKDQNDLKTAANDAQDLNYS